MSAASAPLALGTEQPGSDPAYLREICGIMPLVEATKFEDDAMDEDAETVRHDDEDDKDEDEDDQMDSSGVNGCRFHSSYFLKRFCAPPACMLYGPRSSVYLLRCFQDTAVMRPEIQSSRLFSKVS